MKNYLAFDLGASSGRAIIGKFEDGKFALTEVHRFENGPVEMDGGLFWDISRLFEELKEGLRKALATGVTIDGIGIDTWGVDVCFINEDGKIIGPPHHYRDPRTDDISDWTFSKVPAEKIYKETGIQFMNFNTIFQLSASLRDNDPFMQNAKKMLFVPNALTYLFCGRVAAEYSIASTSQLLDAKSGDWAWDIIDALGLKRELFPEIVQPCTVAAPLSEELQKEMGCGPIPVIFIGAHDTASAVASVPADRNSSWAYLSSGTWSLLGVELPEPLINDAAMQANYTNEGGLNRRIRFLSNIMGLWLTQECRNQWKKEGKTYSFVELSQMAAEAEPFRSIVNPDDPSFMTPGNMPEHFAEYCRKTNQPIPDTPARVIRTALESLALRYRQAWEGLEKLLGKKLEVLHLVGGGCQNKLLNQFTANAIQAKVVTGPVEATAMGNIIGQAIALGDVSDLDAARQIVSESDECNSTYLPEDAQAWQEAYDRFLALKKA